MRLLGSQLVTESLTLAKLLIVEGTGCPGAFDIDVDDASAGMNEGTKAADHRGHWS